AEVALQQGDAEDRHQRLVRRPGGRPHPRRAPAGHDNGEGHPWALALAATSTTTSRSSVPETFFNPWVPPGRFMTTSPGPTSKTSPSSSISPPPPPITYSPWLSWSCRCAPVPHPSGTTEGFAKGHWLTR